MVSRVAWPQIVPNQNCIAFCTHSLCAKSSSDLLVASFVQKVIFKYTVVLLESGCFQMVLHFPKMDVVLNLQGLLDRKSTERVIHSDFVLVGQFNGAFWHNAAVVLNSIDRDL